MLSKPPKFIWIKKILIETRQTHQPHMGSRNTNKSLPQCCRTVLFDSLTPLFHVITCDSLVSNFFFFLKKGCYFLPLLDLRSMNPTKKTARQPSARCSLHRGSVINIYRSLFGHFLKINPFFTQNIKSHNGSSSGNILCTNIDHCRPTS